MTDRAPTQAGEESTPEPGPPAPNPFVAYRRHLDVHRFALDRGLSDDAYVDLVVDADLAVAGVDGRGFVVTPMIQLDVDGGPPVWGKIETGAVAGSHKARHLFGLLLHLLIEEATSTTTTGSSDLAIASCGNAALGAAVVARSAGRRLRVFVPTNADPAIRSELERLGADVTTCPRRADEEGDPCMAALDRALDEGARAFTVQGNRAPLVIDGGRTLGLELAGQLDHRDVTPGAVFVQIGGGALATAIMDGLARAWPDRPLPRLHPVQARAAHPYVAAWRRAVEALLAQAGERDPGSDQERAALLRDSFGAVELHDHLASRPGLMSPWPGTPQSVASGILDDVTYDWVTVMVHQIRTGGWPVLVEEPTFAEAVEIAARQVTPAPDETGAAGLAGLLELRRSAAEPATAGGASVVFLTGAAR